MKKLIYLIEGLLLTGISFTSCDDFLTQEPESMLTMQQVFSKVENIDPYVKGLYKNWRDMHKERGGFYLGTDEAYQGGVQYRDNADTRGIETYSNELSATNGMVLTNWMQRFNVITAAAALIQEMEITRRDSLKDVLYAEACFLRAANYFEVAQIWGRAPIIDYNRLDVYGTKLQEADSLYNFIIRDLNVALKYLPSVTDSNYVDNSRATVGIAHALLGKVYLYAPETYTTASGETKQLDIKDYAKAAEQFKYIVNAAAPYNSPYATAANIKKYADIFDEYKEDGDAQKKEFIYAFRFRPESPDNSSCEWAMGSRAVSVMSDIEAVIPFAGFDLMMPPREKYLTEEEGGIWEEGDLRKDVSIRYDFTYNGKKPELIGYCYGDELLPHFKKYEDWRILDNKRNTWYSGKPVPFIRYADCALNLAECLWFMGEKAEAIKIVNNNVRARAFGGRLLSKQKWTTDMSDDMFIEKLLDERFRELNTEGWRKLDLIRLGKLKEYVENSERPVYDKDAKQCYWVKQNSGEGNTKVVNINMKQHQFWPIPLDEINKNPEIELADQNFGY